MEIERALKNENINMREKWAVGVVRNSINSKLTKQNLKILGLLVSL